MIAIQLLQKVGLLEVLDNGAFYLNQVKNMVGSETVKAEQMRKSRARKKQKQLEGHNVTKALPNCSENGVENVTPENRDKRIENRDKIVEEIKEENPTTTTESENTFSEIHKLYAGEISRNGLFCYPMETEKIKNLLAEYGAEKMRKAIEIAVMRNKRSLGYIEGILKKDDAPSKKSKLSDEYDIDF